MLLNEETAKLDHHGLCPKCGADWNGGDMFDVLRQQAWCADQSDEELREYISKFYAAPHKFSRLVGIEYGHDHPEHYDGVSEWQCPDCKHRWPRFT